MAMGEREEDRQQAVFVSTSELRSAEAALAEVCCVTEPWAGHPLKRVVEQTERRVFDGETVPASEKVVSLFEPHTDIICKGGRQTHYGHKINLSTGRSALSMSRARPSERDSSRSSEFDRFAEQQCRKFCRERPAEPS